MTVRFTRFPRKMSRAALRRMEQDPWSRKWNCDRQANRQACRWLLRVSAAELFLLIYGPPR